MFRFWLFIAGIIGFAAVAAGAWGAHVLNDLADYPHFASIFETAQRFHLVHSIALFGTAILFAATDERRNIWGAAMLNLAALAFLAGIVLFSGGIYYQVAHLAQSGLKVVPAGGISFMVGWVAVALSAFGHRKARS